MKRLARARGRLEKQLRTDLEDALELQKKATRGISRVSKVVKRAPGSSFLDVVRWLPVSNKSIERVFVPVVHDFQREYIEALANGAKKRAKMIRVRYSAILLLTLLAFVGVASVKRVVEWSKLV